jgi:hypothetical protein
MSGLISQFSHLKFPRYIFGHYVVVSIIAPRNQTSNLFECYFSYILRLGQAKIKISQDPFGSFGDEKFGISHKHSDTVSVHCKQFRKMIC